jgi:hypothetical protein
MRCLLDKVTARNIMQGLLKLTEGREPTDVELFALDLYSRATVQGITLFILPQTEKVLQRLTNLPHFAELIHSFLARTQVAQPARYFKRWARRLRDYGFTKEDADVLALATFGTNQSADILGMHVVATFDQPMINQWTAQLEAIQKRLSSMQCNIPVPYRRAPLPQVQRPEYILGL